MGPLACPAIHLLQEQTIINHPTWDSLVVKRSWKAGGKGGSSPTGPARADRGCFQITAFPSPVFLLDLVLGAHTLGTLAEELPREYFPHSIYI